MPIEEDEADDEEEEKAVKDDSDDVEDSGAHRSLAPAQALQCCFP